MIVDQLPISRDEVKGFIVSHLQFSMLDRYAGHVDWCLWVIESFIDEKPLNEEARHAVPPRFNELLRGTLGSLYEYCKMQKFSLTYSQYQAIVREYYEALKEGIEDDE